MLNEEVKGQVMPQSGRAESMVPIHDDKNPFAGLNPTTASEQRAQSAVPGHGSADFQINGETPVNILEESFNSGVNANKSDTNTSTVSYHPATENIV